MKKIARITCAFYIFTLMFPLFSIWAEQGNFRKTDFRGLWVASVVNIDYPSKPAVESDKLKSEALKVLDDAKNTGFNAVFLQVRPTADALYKSKIFPWSKYLTGSQGTAPSDNFDPLEFWVSEAHKRGMELHAWINPYRVTKKAANEPSQEVALLAPSNPARTHSEWVVKHSDGNLYFDPGIPEVRKLIIDGVLEIIENYPVDGIHFDDYFYPGKDFSDKKTYEKYGKDYKDINDWRRENVNSLIRELSNEIKSVSKNVRFGVSPFGIWANKKNNSLGSDTNGMESYHDHYADSRKWVKFGWVDYIVPQLYWNIGFAVADYSKLLTWWKGTVSGTGVELYIGQAAYRAGNQDSQSPWYGISEIEKQLKLNEKTPGVNGSIFFNYKSMADNPALGAMIKAIYEQRDGIAAKNPVKVSRPSANMKTSFDKYYLSGTSDPGKPLYINGKAVETRSGQGNFGVLMPLSKGANNFTVSQEASYETRVIYRLSSSAPEKMDSAEIPLASTFPQSPEYRTRGEKITLTCQAPIGSKVTVKIGRKSYTMTPATSVSKGTDLYPTTYSYEYTIPSHSGIPRNIDLGAPVYTLNYNGIKKSTTAPAKVVAVMKNSPFYGKITKDVADTYNSPTSDNGAAFELYKGMIDYVTGMTGNYVRLSSGQWVRKENVETYTSKLQAVPSITNAVYTTGEKWDTLKLDITSDTAAISSFDGNKLTMSISRTAKGIEPKLPENALVSRISAGKTDNVLQYVLELKENQKVEGYYIEKSASGLNLHIKRPAKLAQGDKPLSGITMMIDPGHGGSETGAIGPQANRPEKDINLKASLKLRTELERLGAKVYMTRTADVALSLGDRLAASRDSKPDMFISIHANSMEDNVDISKVEGFSVFYREPLAKPLSEKVLNQVIKDLGRTNKGINVRNFYVTRGTWTPSILIESGFITNPREFEWLIDEKEQTRLVKSLADAIVSYFKG